MINMAICDDDPDILDTFKSYSARYLEASPSVLDVIFLSDPQTMTPELLAREDIVILDIQMEPVNGIELAREIRKINENNIIIFSTNYLEYALQGYEVAAFRYLKKPIGYEGFCKVMDEAVQRYRKSAQASIALRCGRETEQIRIADIMYCETQLGHVKITLTDGRTLMANTGISQLEESFTDYDFFRCHKACLVNLNAVRQPMKTDVLMKDGAKIPVSKHRMKEFMTALMKFWGGQLR